MTDREALTEAVEADLRAATWRELLATAMVLQPAARERLAQLPEKCGNCNGRGTTLAVTCPACHGSGKVYPAELAERIVTAVEDRVYTEQSYAVAVAVLDALNETP